MRVAPDFPIEGSLELGRKRSALEMQSLSGAATETSTVQRIYASIVLSCALSLYVWTLAPTVTLVDSGELIVAARSLGVAHPPGFPFYVLLANAATRLPFGNVAL